MQNRSPHRRPWAAARWAVLLSSVLAVGCWGWWSMRIGQHQRRVVAVHSAVVASQQRLPAFSAMTTLGEHPASTFTDERETCYYASYRRVLGSRTDTRTTMEAVSTELIRQGWQIEGDWGEPLPQRMLLRGEQERITLHLLTDSAQAHSFGIELAIANQQYRTLLVLSVLVLQPNRVLC